LEEVNEIKAKLRAKTVTVFNKTAPSVKVTLDDFDILKVLGRGAFGKVYQILWFLLRELTGYVGGNEKDQASLCNEVIT